MFGYICNLTKGNVMLILTRRTGESIRINDDIVIRILRFKGNQVALGIDAPLSHSVHRQEIYELIQEEKKNDPYTGAIRAD